VIDHSSALMAFRLFLINARIQARVIDNFIARAAAGSEKREGVADGSLNRLRPFFDLR
jgi:hypothetical protein